MRKVKASLAFLIILFITILFMPIYASATTENAVQVGNESELRTALESGKSVELLNDIIVTEKSTNANGRSTSIAITGKDTITIDGNGYTITGSKQRTVFEIYATGNLNVTFDDVKIINSYSYGRCIDTRTANISLTLNSVTLTTTSTGNNQPLTIGGDYAEAITVKMNNSTIYAGVAGYGITTFNPVNLTIDQKSSITGYGALYLKGKDNSQGSAGSKIIVQNESKLIGNNIHSGDSNAFGTIVFEDNNMNVDIINSQVESTGTGSEAQIAFLQNKENLSNITVNVTGSSKITVDNKTELIYGNNITMNIADTVSVLEVYPSTSEIPTISSEKVVEEVQVGVKEATKTEEILLNSLANNASLMVNSNNSINVKVEIADVSKTLDETVITAMKTKAGNATVATFFDVTIAVQKNNAELVGTLDELTEEIELMVLLPEELKIANKDMKRTYYVIRKHGDEIEILDATLSSDGKSLVFKSDKFSTYALAYEDSKIETTTNPETSDSIALYIVLSCLSVIGLSGTGLYIHKKRLSN